MRNIDVLAAIGLVPKPRSDVAESFGAIAFDQRSDGVWHVHKTPKPSMGPEEADEQARLFTWLRSTGRALGLRAHSVPNDGGSSKERVGALKRTGLTPGVCDLYVYSPWGHLAIEMKRANGTWSDVKPQQLEWLQGLVGFPSIQSCVCFGYEAAMAAISRFILEQAHGQGQPNH